MIALLVSALTCKSLDVITPILTRKINKLGVNDFTWTYQRTEVTG